MIERLRNIRRLCYIMSATDACRFTLRKNHPGVFSISLRQTGHRVELRGGTTDIRCFLKIFVERNYSPPFQISPRFIVDAGANTGLSALYFAETYPDATIFAIEPETDNFMLLKRNCAHIDRIKPLHGALWSTPGSVSLTGAIDGQAWAFSIERKDKPVLGSVEAFTIHQLLKMAPDGRIDILKLDIEGSERELFSKNTDWLDHVSVMAIELHDRYEPGCAKTVYQKLVQRPFTQEVRGENVFIRLSGSGTQHNHEK
jgi:FkbM family methyltransferase